MSKYRKIDTKIWNDAKFRALSDDGQMIFLLFLTHPSMTAIGALPATVPGMAHTKKWSVERFRKGFAELLSNGMAKADEDAGLIYLPNFLKYNQPENPNVVKAWAGGVDMLPECELKTRIISDSYASLCDRPQSFKEAFVKLFGKQGRNGLANGMANQEPEPEPEQEPILAYEHGDFSKDTYARDRLAQSHPHGEASKPVGPHDDTAEGAKAHSHQGASSRAQTPNPYEAAKNGGDGPAGMFTAFDVPASSDSARRFLIGKGVPGSQLDRCVNLMMAGKFTPFDLEGAAA